MNSIRQLLGLAGLSQLALCAPVPEAGADTLTLNFDAVGASAAPG